MENILQAQKKIDAVYTHDDDMAQGVVQAIRNAGRAGRDVPDGRRRLPGRMKQIKEGGLYRATFLYNPNMAAHAVNMARLIALGQGFPELSPPEVPRAAHRARRRGDEGQRRQVREVRVQLGEARKRPARFARGS